MKIESRIPALTEISFDGALLWFSEMKCRELLFHPEDDPAHVIRVADGAHVFSDREVAEVRFLLNEMEEGLGHENMIEAAYPIFVKAGGIQLDA